MKWKWLSLVAALCFTLSCAKEPNPTSRVAATFHAEELPENYQADLKKRQMFPFSVVPGGTLHKSEALSKAASDPVVRQHYQGVQLDRLQPFRLTRPAQGYVSFRVGNRIFWTAKRLYLKPGEVLLSDGANLIRGRCGNRIALDPQSPVLPAGEPTEAALDLPSHEMPNFASGSLDPGLFKLPANLPPPKSIESPLHPAESFTVAPSPYAPGMIAGGLPGALPEADRRGVLYLDTGYYGLFPVPPSWLEQPGFPAPPGSSGGIAFPPVEIAFHWPGPTVPISFLPGFGTPPFFVTGGIPLFPGGGGPTPFTGLAPYFMPPLLVGSASAPIETGVVVPPGEIQPPHPPEGPPNEEPPPGFEPIPEPNLLWLVGLTAASMWMVRTRARL